MKAPQKQTQQMRTTMVIGSLLLLFLLFHVVSKPPEEQKALKFSEFIEAVQLPAEDQNRVKEVTFRENEIMATRVDNSTFKTYGPNDAELRTQLQEKGVKVNFEPPEEAGLWKSLLINSLPMLLLLFLFFFSFANSRSAAAKPCHSVAAGQSYSMKIKSRLLSLMSRGSTRQNWSSRKLSNF